MKRFVTSLILLLSLTFSSALRAKASSQWMWHGAFPWVYSHAENSWWYMKAGTDGKFLAWKQGDEKWYSFDEVSKAWVVLPGQEEEQQEEESGQEEQQVPTANKAGDTYTVQGAANMEMIWVEPGTFTMGSPESEAGHWEGETQHQVTLTKGFYLGKYEVTQAQYEAVMTGNTDGLSATPSHFSGNPNRPVEKVSWGDVQVFLTRLNATEQAAGRLPAGWEYALPTEAQWEYACRAGTTTAFSWGDTSSSTQANFNGDYPYGGAAKGPSLAHTTDIGQYAANPWGFFDMHGNVYEWCADWYRYEDYTSGAVSDPVGHAVGSYRVLRGGSWNGPGAALRSAERSYDAPGNRNNILGFRVGFKASQ